MKNQVRITAFRQSYRIEFPKHSHCPMLFLEWLQEAQEKYKELPKFEIQSKIAIDEVLDDKFYILIYASGGVARDCFAYIKNNIGN